MFWGFRLKAAVRSALAMLLLLVILVTIPIITIGMTHSASFDIQAHLLTLWRMTALLIWVVSARYLISMINADDLEEDYARINEGNTAVGIYRGLEFFGLIIAAAVLIAQI